MTLKFSFPFSLNNLSNDIRWSLDLRWQQPDKSVGFYGMKQGVAMRSQKPGFKVDWETFKKAHFHNIDDAELKVSSLGSPLFVSPKAIF